MLPALWVAPALGFPVLWKEEEKLTLLPHGCQKPQFM